MYKIYVRSELDATAKDTGFNLFAKKVISIMDLVDSDSRCSPTGTRKLPDFRYCAVRDGIVIDPLILLHGVFTYECPINMIEGAAPRCTYCPKTFQARFKSKSE